MTTSKTDRRVRGAIVNSVVIDRDADVVFEYITDLLREHEWNEQLRSVDKLTDGPLTVGSKFRVHFGRTVGDSILDIVGYERPVSWQTTATSRASTSSSPDASPRRPADAA